MNRTIVALIVTVAVALAAFFGYRSVQDTRERQAETQRANELTAEIETIRQAEKEAQLIVQSAKLEAEEQKRQVILKAEQDAQGVVQRALQEAQAKIAAKTEQALAEARAQAEAETKSMLEQARAQAEAETKKTIEQARATAIATTQKIQREAERDLNDQIVCATCDLVDPKDDLRVRQCLQFIQLISICEHDLCECRAVDVAAHQRRRPPLRRRPPKRVVCGFSCVLHVANNTGGGK